MVATRPMGFDPLVANPAHIVGVSAGMAPAFWATTAGAALLHGVFVAAFAWQMAPHSPAPVPEGASIQVEYIDQSASTKGVAAPDATAIPTDDPTAAGAPPGTSPTPPAESYADVPMPPDAIPSPGTDTGSGQRTSDTGTGDTERDALKVTGRDMVSSGPDAHFRNLPPNYPRAAVNAHQQGSVQVAVHIAASGLPDDVEMLISSGSDALDHAVRDAVLTWHFTPAMRDGTAVASVYKLQMNFRNQGL